MSSREEVIVLARSDVLDEYLHLGVLVDALVVVYIDAAGQQAEPGVDAEVDNCEVVDTEFVGKGGSLFALYVEADFVVRPLRRPDDACGPSHRHYERLRSRGVRQRISPPIRWWLRRGRVPRLVAWRWSCGTASPRVHYRRGFRRVGGLSDLGFRHFRFGQRVVLLLVLSVWVCIIPISRTAEAIGSCAILNRNG